MDPLTRAAKSFMREVEAFALPAPGHRTVGPRVLRAVSTKGERNNVHKALRWLEHTPQNARPVIVVDAEAYDALGWVQAIDAKVREDYAAVRAGLVEEGATLPELPPAPQEVDAQSLATTLDRAADNLAEVLEGLYVALIPQANQQTASYRGVVTALAHHARSEALILVAWDCTAALDGLGLVRADFAVDEDDLWAHLEMLGTEPSKGPKPSMPSATASQRAALAAEGTSLPSNETVAHLRKLLIRASRALANRQPRVAVRNLRAARALCHTDGMHDQEAVVLVGLGTAYLHTRNTQGARASYVAAAKLAESTGNARLAELARRTLDADGLTS